MNERINELRLDAGISLLHDEPYLVAVNKSGNIEDPMIGLEKFAELIVRECVSVINTEAAEHGDDEIERAWKMGTEFAVYQIKKHFGVEE